MGKLLTISIAAYNVEQYIDETLSSCNIDKKYMDNMEILIINDGSTDKTVDIAEKYVKKYPNTFQIINKKNGGYGTTVNIGIRKATGKYFKLLDGDDWFNKNALCELLEILQTEESDLIITDFIEKYESGKIVQKKINTIYGKAYSLNNQKFPLTMHGVCYKTCILKDNNINLEKGILYTDSEYVIYPLFYVDLVSHYPLFLYEYRLGRTGQSVGIKSYCNHVGDMNKVVDNMISYYNSHKIRNGAEKIILYNISNYYRVNLSIFLWKKISKQMKQEIIKRENEVKNANLKVYNMTIKENLKFWLLRKSYYKLYYVLALYVHLKNILVK